MLEQKENIAGAAFSAPRAVEKHDDAGESGDLVPGTSVPLVRRKTTE